MAVKDLEKYYEKLTKQHIELNEEYLDYARNNVLTEADEKEHQVEDTNWKRVTYLMYLLHKPTKKCKHKKYELMNKKLLATVGKENTAEAVLKENKDAISRVTHD